MRSLLCLPLAAALSLGLAACGSSHSSSGGSTTSPGSTGAATSAIQSGDQQTGVGVVQPPMGAMPMIQTLPTPLTVAVTDSSGNPVTNATVTFTVATIPTGGFAQFVDPQSAQTTTIVDIHDASAASSASGLYEIGFSPGAAGVNTVVAHVTIPGSASPPDLTFHETGTSPSQPAGVTATIAGGNGQTGTGIVRPFMGAMPLAPNQLPAALAVQVLDGSGNPVTTATVTFTVTSMPAGGFAQLTDGKSAGTTTVIDINDATVVSSPTGIYQIGFSPGAGGANTITAHIDVAGATSPPDLTFTETGK